MKNKILILLIVRLLAASNLVVTSDTLNDLHYGDEVQFNNKSTFLINQSQDTITMDSVTLDTNSLGYPVEKFRILTGGYGFHIRKMLNTDTLKIHGWEKISVIAPGDSVEIRLDGFDDGTAGFIKYIEKYIDIVFVDFIFHLGEEQVRLTLSGFYHKYPDNVIDKKVFDHKVKESFGTFNVKGQVVPSSKSAAISAKNIRVGYGIKEINLK